MEENKMRQGTQGDYRVVFLNKGTEEYHPPEMLAPVPEGVSKEDQDLYRAMNMGNYTYFLSGRVVLTAQKAGNRVQIEEKRESAETQGLIMFRLFEPDPALEARIATLVDGQGTLIRDEESET